MTRLALPENDAYIVKLGIAVYSFASINSFLTEIMCYLDTSLNRTELQSKDSGAILSILKKIIDVKPRDSKSDDLDYIVKEFEKYKNFRNDIVHSYPITTSDGEQILHRRLDRENKYFEITEEFLDSFIKGLPEISSRLYKIRDSLQVDSK